eukprot:scaffold74366_cov67-Phaeocystis_antarctica.AAC.1
MFSTASRPALSGSRQRPDHHHRRTSTHLRIPLGHLPSPACIDACPRTALHTATAAPPTATPPLRSSAACLSISRAWSRRASPRHTSASSGRGRASRRRSSGCSRSPLSSHSTPASSYPSAGPHASHASPYPV